MRVDVVCIHLRRLASAGLIQRRRSGVWCYCAARSPYSDQALSGKIMSWLRGALRNPARIIKHSAVVQLRNVSQSELETQLHDFIFEAATAFANVRRLQILRRLAGGDVVTAENLARELSMSAPAVSRHTTKLVRRGYVEACRAGRSLTYRLARKFKTPVHAKFLEIVRVEWDKR